MVRIANEIRPFLLDTSVVIALATLAATAATHGLAPYARDAGFWSMGVELVEA